MSAILAFTAATVALQGCIIFDRTCPGCDPDRPPRDDRPDRDPPDDSGSEDTGGEDTGGEVEPPPPAHALALTPDEAEQGETFIASLRSSGVDPLDLGRIDDLRFYGDVSVLAAAERSAELLLTLRGDPAAEPGTVDLLAALDDGTAVWQPAVLTLFPAGSGHEAGGSQDGDPCE